jgi:hypothetical protein
MLQFDPQVLKYLPADRLAEHLKQLHPGMAVTHGRHESLVPGYPVGSVHRVTRGPIELLLRRKDEDQVEVWPSLCPHEGGLMDKKHLCDSPACLPLAWPSLRSSRARKRRTRLLALSTGHRSLQGRPSRGGAIGQ